MLWDRKNAIPRATITETTAATIMIVVVELWEL
jgi:hypothetical protein